MALFFRNAPKANDAMEELRAEYDNYRRRTALQLQEADGAAARRTAAAFLPLYDDLARALDHPCSDGAYYRGVELIFREMTEILAALGVKPMDSKGKIFNPAYHEAVEQVTDPALRGEEIAEVLQVGFTMDDEVIRHAKVIVANCQ